MVARERCLLTANAPGWTYGVRLKTVGVVMGNNLIRSKTLSFRHLKLLTNVIIAVGVCVQWLNWLVVGVNGPERCRVSKL